MWEVWNAPKKCEIIEQPKKSNNFFNESDQNIDIFRYFNIFMEISILLLKYKKVSIYRFFSEKNRYRIELKIADNAHH